MRHPESIEPVRPEEGSFLDEVLRLVHEREGIDLSLFRRKSIERRVTSRLQKLACKNLEDYATLLYEDPAESRKLLEHVTIKVSRFFRDAHVFTRLREEILPDLAEQIGSERGLRVWSAGCGNGEEAYSMAIVLSEVAKNGPAGSLATVRGTDIDEGALAVARRGVYSETAVEESPPHLTEAYFSRREGQVGPAMGASFSRRMPLLEVSTALRDVVTFLRHDLLSGLTSPDGREFDVVLCRNVLIYFERRAQGRVYDLLVRSVLPGGYLCLGEAEQLPLDYERHFETVDWRGRIYRKHH